jgi:hypothetical protein
MVEVDARSGNQEVETVPPVAGGEQRGVVGEVPLAKSAVGANLETAGDDATQDGSGAGEVFAGEGKGVGHGWLRQRGRHPSGWRQGKQPNPRHRGSNATAMASFLPTAWNYLQKVADRFREH